MQCKHIHWHKHSRYVHMRMNCVLWTISMWDKQSVIDTYIYILEVIAWVAISRFTDIVKIVISVYKGNECKYFDIHAIVFT